MSLRVANVLASLYSTAFAVCLPDAAVAQATSARPASVSLIVVVPAPLPSAAPIVSGEAPSIVRRGPHAVEVATSIGIVGRPATRVEVSLGRARPADMPPVWVSNSRGELERVTASGRVIALDRPVATTHPVIRFHVEAARPLPNASLDIPVEYRVRVGSGDQISTWTFASSLRLDTAP